MGGCSKTYLELSSLIRHEKRVHGFYRKEQKEHAQCPADEFDVNEFFMKNEYDMPASTPQMWISSAISTPSPTYFPLTPSGTSLWSPMCFASPMCYESSLDDGLLSEMIPELFSNSKASPTLSNFGIDNSFQSSVYGYQLDLQMPPITDIVPAFDYNSQFWNL